MKKKLLSLFLVGALAAGMLAGCGKADDGKKDSSKTEESDNGGDTPLVVGYSQFSAKFSPFFCDSDYDRDATDMTQVLLISNDRAGAIIYNGIEGETTSYNGTDYTYYSPSNVEVDIDEATGDTTYTVTIRDDIKFSDGEPMTIDDVIFTMYVLSDTDYDGSSTLYSTPIKGMKAYRANSTAADSVTPEMVQEKIDEMPEALATQISEEIIAPVLTSEFAWVESDVVTDPTSYGLEEGVTTAQAFAALYAPDYDPADKDDETVLADVIAQYGSDYATLGTNYAGDAAYFDEDVNSMAETAVIEDLRAAGEGEEVANISGIERVDDYTLKITTDGFDATMIYQLGIEITPMHYYGDKSLYDYDNNSFGFTRGDLSIVRDKTDKPMGAGPYVFEKYENKTIYYTANENYYLGAPKTKNVQFKETSEAEKVTAVDYGLDFYAPQTLLTKDGRRVMIGWMQSWDAKIKPAGHTWSGMMTIPRELTLKNGRIYQNPVRELEKYRKHRIAYQGVSVEHLTELPGIRGRVLDLQIELTSFDFTHFAIRFAKNEDYEMTLQYHADRQCLTIDRTHSGLERDVVCRRKMEAVPMTEDGKKVLKFRILLDWYSVEVFVNDGEKVMSSIFYTPMEADEIFFDTDGAARINVEKYDICTQE